MLWSAVICLIPFAANADNARSAEKAAELSAVSSESISDASQLILPTDKLKIYTSNGIRTVTVEEYTAYAVLEEVPYIMDTEAMKAQAAYFREKIPQQGRTSPMTATNIRFALPTCRHGKYTEKATPQPYPQPKAPPKAPAEK